MENKPEFICRCSSIGKLMTDPREKGNGQKYKESVSMLAELKEKYANTANKETKTAQNQLARIHKLDQEVRILSRYKDEIRLSKSTISVIHDWMKDQLGYPRQELRSKYTQKGLLMEGDAIDFIADHYGWSGVKKNTERKTDEYITGEADVVLPDRVMDVKCSWSGDSFPLMDTDIPIDGYVWQGLGYMALWGKDNFQLTYALMDAPDAIVDKEANRVRYDLGLDEVDMELWEDIKSMNTFSHLPAELRIKSFYVDFNKDLIDRVHERVEIARKWVEGTNFYQLWEQIKKK